MSPVTLTSWQGLRSDPLVFNVSFFLFLPCTPPALGFPSPLSHQPLISFLPPSFSFFRMSNKWNHANADPRVWLLSLSILHVWVVVLLCTPAAHSSTACTMVLTRPPGDEHLVNSSCWRLCIERASRGLYHAAWARCPPCYQMFSHSDGCVVVSHCGFNVRFPMIYDKWKLS